jgi:hypothetical protein
MNLNQIEEEQTPPAYICYSYFDQQGNPQYAWVPEYYNIFAKWLALIQEIKPTINKKWTDKQINSYQTFLTDL